MSTVGQRHAALDLLRGVAALSVAWFHFTNGNDAFLPAGGLKPSGQYGWMGVEVFFVISGFIIPFALSRAQYQIADYGTFLLKRIVRLDPPYLVSIALVIVLGYASSAAPGFRGTAFTFSLPQLLLHLGYINVFFGYPWLNPVFWTLAIELQYYLAIGLLFPLIASPTASVRWGLLAALVALALLFPASQFLCHWLVLFVMGILTFQFRTAMIARTVYLAALVLLGLAATYTYGIGVAGVGVATAVVIAFVQFGHNSPLLFFGHISYSLYLLHVPIGGRVINLSLRFVHSLTGKCFVLVTALGASLLAAWILHRFVERPAQKWSSRIGYKNRSVGPSGFGPMHG